MTTANLRDTAALQRLAMSLKRFETDVSENLQAFGLQIQRQQRELEGLRLERQGVWRRSVSMMQQAAGALSACEASGYTDKYGHYHAPDCSMQRSLWRKAVEAELEAKTAFIRVEKKIRKLEEQILIFQKQSQRMKVFLESDLAKSLNHLNFLSGTLQDYTQISLSGSANPTSSATSSADAGDFTKLVDAALGAPLGVFEALAGIISPGINQQPASPFWLPEHFPKPFAGGDWAFVPLEQIDDSDSYVQSIEDFKKVPLEQMQRGWQVFYNDILPAVQQGKTADYFDALDSSLGLTPAKGFRQVFDAFLGVQQWNEPIRLERRGEKYVVTNGFHRIFAAKQNGLSSIIASVGEK